MSIKVNRGSLSKDEYKNFEQCAKSRLNGDDYSPGLGQIEVLTATAENNSRAIGRLLDLLVSKNQISHKEAAKVLIEYFDGDIEVI